MSNKLFRIKIIQPSFDKIYKKYENLFSVANKKVAKSNDKKEPAQKLDELIDEIEVLKDLKRFSAEHVRWVATTKNFLNKIFGEMSQYYLTFISFTWSKKGSYMIGGPARPNESFNPQLGVERVNQEAYLKELEATKGLLLAAKDDLEENGLVNLGLQEGAKIFPEELLKKSPPDVKKVCEEFNYNFVNCKLWGSMLLLRRLLPLIIVRKFQIMGKEDEIKDDGDYFETKNLLGQVEKYLKEKKVYKDILNYKILTDSSQHSFTFSPELSDVEGAAIKMRLLLEDLFYK